MLWRGLQLSGWDKDQQLGICGRGSLRGNGGLLALDGWEVAALKPRGSSISESGSQMVEREVGAWCWGGVCRIVGTIPEHCGKEKAKPQGKLSIYWSVYIPTHTYDYGLRVVTKRTKSQTHAAKLWLLPGVVGPVVHSHGLRQAANEGTHWTEHQTRKHSDRKRSEETTGQQNNIHMTLCCYGNIILLTNN